jgi:transposase
LEVFVRKKVNKSGSTTIVIVDKSGGSFQPVKTFGTSSDPAEIDKLYKQALEWLHTQHGQQLIDFDSTEQARDSYRNMLSNVERTLQNAPQAILNRIYDTIGFDAVGDDILRHLAIARVCQPMSKVATADYLKSYFDEDVKLHNIYRYMDKLYSSQRERIQQISVKHTMQVLGGRIGLVFYDVTTLYFESVPDPSDELRQDGYSKDGKTAESQIVLGLLVSEDGYPLSYSVFNGKQYEGYTMIPIIDDFVQRFSLKDFIVVADAGLMSDTNVRLLESAGYKYIIGARIRKESPAIKEWILGIEKVDGTMDEYKKRGGRRLVVSYSDARAKKNAYNREKGVERLRKAYAKGTLTKDKVNKRGYNKFLDISKDITVTINEEKIREDALWDGLKGYVTNTNLDMDEVIRQYHGLWVVERAFRIGKGQLEMRPMFHFTEKRIEAHICICFVAYKMYKELERSIRQLGIPMSVDKVLSIAKTITTIRLRLPNGELYAETLYTTPQQEAIRPLIEPKTL